MYTSISVLHTYTLWSILYDIIIADEVSHALFRCLLGSVQRKPWRRFGHPGCFPMANLRIHKKLLRDQCPGPEMNPGLPKSWGPAPFHPGKSGFQLALKVIPRIAPLVQPKSEDSPGFPVQLESPLQDTFDPRRKKASVGNSDDAAVSSLFWSTASCGSLGSCWSIIHNSSYPSEIILNSPKAHLKLSEIQLNPSSIPLNSILMHDSCNPKSNLINHSLMFPSTCGGGSSISARWCPPVTSCAPQWCLLVYEP